jgi:hypothetical protein
LLDPANTAVKVIEVTLTGNAQLTNVDEIPSGKTVIFRSGNSYTVTPLAAASGGLDVAGTVYVGGNVSLVANATNPVAATGVINVGYANGGTLAADVATVTAIHSNVSIDGGTLEITAGTMNLQAVTQALGFIGNNGTLDVTALTFTDKPAEIATAVKNYVSATKWLAIESAASDAAAISIPVGLDLTTPSGDLLATAVSLDVKGKLTVGNAAASLAAATTVTVSGTLDLGANTGLILGAGKLTTSGNGVVRSSITSDAKLAVLLASAGAGTGAELNIEQLAGVTLSTAAAVVKAGTTLTLTGGTLTADNAANKTLTVAGTVVLDGGSIVTGTTTIGSNPAAINITGTTGRIEAGGVVVSGAGAFYDSTGSSAIAMTLSNAGFVGGAQGKATLKGATTINAGEGKVVLSVDGSGTSDTGTFLSPTATQFAVKVDADGNAVIDLDNSGTAIAAALTIGAKGSLAVASGGIIKVMALSPTTLLSGTAETEKLSIASGAVLEVNGDSSTTSGVFTDASGAFSGKGKFVTGVTLTGKSDGKWE